MRRTILLADDSPTIQRLVTSTFAGGEFDVVSVSNGEAAIRKFDEIHPHVVLADIYMPGKNGYEVCTHVREHPLWKDTPVVLLVGAFDAFDEASAKEIGATAHITKPFEPSALILLVESLKGPELAQETKAKDLPPVVPAPVPAVAVPEPEFAPEPAAPQTPPPAPVPAPVPVAIAVTMAVQAPPPAVEPQDDLLGLESLFHDPVSDPVSGAAVITEQDIDRIADRVIQRLSAQVIENIAWEIVPDITEKIVREEFKRINER